MRKCKLNLGNREIEDWLNSRDWIFHYSGNGDSLNALFSPFDEEDWAEDGRFKIAEGGDSGLPLYGKSYNTVDLVRESIGTYCLPSVHLAARRCSNGGYISIQVHFAHKRAGCDYEPVFSGYVESLDELKQVFILLGLNKEHLK